MSRLHGSRQRRCTSSESPRNPRAVKYQTRGTNTTLGMLICPNCKTREAEIVYQVTDYLMSLHYIGAFPDIVKSKFKHGGIPRPPESMPYLPNLIRMYAKLNDREKDDAKEQAKATTLDEIFAHIDALDFSEEAQTVIGSDSKAGSDSEIELKRYASKKIQIDCCCSTDSDKIKLPRTSSIPRRVFSAKKDKRPQEKRHSVSKNDSRPTSRRIPQRTGAYRRPTPPRDDNRSQSNSPSKDNYESDDTLSPQSKDEKRNLKPKDDAHFPPKDEYSCVHAKRKGDFYANGNCNSSDNDEYPISINEKRHKDESHSNEKRNSLPRDDSPNENFNSSDNDEYPISSNAKRHARFKDKSRTNEKRSSVPKDECPVENFNSSDNDEYPITSNVKRHSRYKDEPHSNEKRNSVPKDDCPDENSNSSDNDEYSILSNAKRHSRAKDKYHTHEKRKVTLPNDDENFNSSDNDEYQYSKNEKRHYTLPEERISRPKYVDYPRDKRHVQATDKRNTPPREDPNSKVKSNSSKSKKDTYMSPKRVSQIIDEQYNALTRDNTQHNDETASVLKPNHDLEDSCFVAKHKDNGPSSEKRNSQEFAVLEKRRAMATIQNSRDAIKRCIISNYYPDMHLETMIEEPELSNLEETETEDDKSRMSRDYERLQITPQQLDRYAKELLLGTCTDSRPNLQAQPSNSPIPKRKCSRLVHKAKSEESLSGKQTTRVKASESSITCDSDDTYELYPIPTYRKKSNQSTMMSSNSKRAQGSMCSVAKSKHAMVITEPQPPPNRFKMSNQCAPKRLPRHDESDIEPDDGDKLDEDRMSIAEVRKTKVKGPMTRFHQQQPRQLPPPCLMQRKPMNEFLRPPNKKLEPPDIVDSIREEERRRVRQVSPPPARLLPNDSAISSILTSTGKFKPELEMEIRALQEERALDSHNSSFRQPRNLHESRHDIILIRPSDSEDADNSDDEHRTSAKHSHY